MSKLYHKESHIIIIMISMKDFPYNLNKNLWMKNQNYKYKYIKWRKLHEIISLRNGCKRVVDVICELKILLKKLFFPHLSSVAKSGWIRISTDSFTFCRFSHQNAYIRTAQPTWARVLSSSKVTGSPTALRAITCINIHIAWKHTDTFACWSDLLLAMMTLTSTSGRRFCFAKTNTSYLVAMNFELKIHRSFASSVFTTNPPLIAKKPCSKDQLFWCCPWQPRVPMSTEVPPPLSSFWSGLSTRRTLRLSRSSRASCHWSIALQKDDFGGNIARAVQSILCKAWGRQPIPDGKMSVNGCPHTKGQRKHASKDEANSPSARGIRDISGQGWQT